MGLLAMGLACSGCSKSSGQLDGGIIRIAYNQAPTHPHYQALERAGERFKEATGGRYEFLIYPNEVLGDQRATLELIQTGQSRWPLSIMPWWRIITRIFNPGTSLYI